MSLWIWLLLSCLLAYAWKLLGYLVPASLLRNPRMSRIAGTMTIGLLASLTVVMRLPRASPSRWTHGLARWPRRPSPCGSAHRFW